MESNLFSLSKIFTERIFRIPDYQRGYAWKEKHYKDFWNDLIQLENGKNHYTGVLTLKDVPTEKLNTWTDDEWIIQSKCYYPYFIVDGQQRLTTAIILIQVIIERVESISEDEINFTSIEDIKKKFISDTKDKGISRSFIFGYEKDNPSYEFLKTEVFLEPSDTSHEKQETIYTQNLEDAKSFFVEKLSDLTISEIEEFYKKLTQHFLFNLYTITDDIDTYISFETMNNRGKPLSHLELLKNRLIYLSTKLTDDNYEKNSLRKKINECWKSIYHQLGRNKNNPLNDDKFLVNHFMVYFGDELWSKAEFENIEHRLPYYYSYQRDEYANYLLENKFTIKNIHESNLEINSISTYVDNLRNSVEYWYLIHNPGESNFSTDIKNWLSKINRLNNDRVSPLIMTFFSIETDEKVRKDFLVELEKLMFITQLSRYGYYDIESIYKLDFLRTAIELKSKIKSSYEVIKSFEKIIHTILSDKSQKQQTIKWYGENGFYHWRTLKYFLYEYDLWLYEQSKTSRKKLHWDEFNSTDYETVEHIFPQRAKKSCWTTVFDEFNTKQRKALRHTLGNLLPLSRPKNSSFSNKCFHEKVANNSNTIGYSYGCYSENEVAQYNQWTSKEILERGLKLVDFMEERWQIKIGTLNDKKRFLGLNFLDEKKPKIKITIPKK